MGRNNHQGCQVVWAFSVIVFDLLLYTCIYCQSASSSSIPHRAKLHTRLTGFGSHSVKKSIFANEKIVETSNTTLWVHFDFQNELLWFQSRQNDNVTQISVSSTSSGGFEATWCSEEVPNASWIPLEGLYGVYQVPSGNIWVLITNSQECYNDAPYWQIRRVNSLELVHVPNSQQLSQRQLKEEARQLHLLRYALRHHDFYFVSNSQLVSDMTRTLQYSIGSLGNTNKTAPPWFAQDALPDSRFFWNEPSVQPLIDLNNGQVNSPYSTLLHRVIPLTSAFVGVQRNITLTNSITYDQLLISRRSRFRAGTRFTKRGADRTGAVANYAETEQVCVLRENGTLAALQSHVQTRGSIPLRWSSPTDVKTYRPRVRIGTDPMAQARAIRSHVMDQWRYYAKESRPLPNTSQIVFVNLIDKHGDQGRLGHAFDEVLQAVIDVYSVGAVNATKPSTESSVHEEETDLQWTVPPGMIRHVWFDFHAECKGGRWDRLENLLKDVSDTLEEQGFFCALRNEREWKMLCRQRGVVRTNCMDCLDRTNVVQSIFGRFMLFRQLYEFPLLSKKSNGRMVAVEHTAAFRRNPLSLPWSKGELAHRLLWADNADAISKLYAGTPALKGDFTRTGKRTKKGALDDGMNSLQRYYLNNFLDADRQEGIDLLTGHADFAVVDDEEEGDIAGVEALSGRGGMTFRDEARAILLGGGGMEGRSEFNQRRTSSRWHGKRHKQKSKGLLSSKCNNLRALDLRWLPGDLQSHMRSQVQALGNIEKGSDLSTSQALEAMDRRAATDQPWWVMTDSSDDERVEVDVNPSSSNAGHMIGAILAAFQAPVATAAVVVCVLFPGLFL